MHLLRKFALGTFLCGLAPTAAASQEFAPSALDVLAGSEVESYLRALQVAGLADWYPFSIRGFSAREVAGMLPADTVPHAWKLSGGRLRQRVAVGGGLGAAFNSSFPYGANDGAIWAGRGMTVSGTGGVAWRVGPFSLLLAPFAFAAQNSSFTLMDNGQSGNIAFNDGRFPTLVDYPQRFGNEPYGRLDPGASGLRFETRVITAGLGTFPMWWGPAAEHPFVLGNNAPGIPHLFVGTGAPVNVGIGRVHGRIVWGYLSQSPYSPVTGSDRYRGRDDPGRERLMSGMVLLFSPRPIPGLELGFVRFAHVPYRPEGAGGEFWRSPWPVFLKKNFEDDDFLGAMNELGSVFARWVFPAAGLELYGEHGHDDWYHDTRDLVQEPDHNKAFVIGFQKSLARSASRLSALRGELINYQLPPLARDRPGQGSIYTHAFLWQGHTHRGQLLGSGAGVGRGAGSVLAYDRYTSRTRTTIAWRRLLRGQAGTYYLTGVEEPRGTDVLHSIGVEHARSLANVRVTTGLELMRNFNRDFERDAFNLNLTAKLQWAPSLRISNALQPSDRLARPTELP